MSKYNKKEINRKFEEIMQDMYNIVNASSKDYKVRILQFFNHISESELLSNIINPYLELEIDNEKYGLCNVGIGYSIDYKVPVNEEIEIGCLLQNLKQYVERPNFINIFTWMYHQNTHDSNIYRFNNEIVRPCFEKLERKLKYKLEDLEDMQNEYYDDSNISIINYGTINNLNNIIGNNNRVESSIELPWDEISKKIIENNEININLKNEILSKLEDLKNNGKTKESFMDKYTKLVSRLGVYYTILEPYIPMIMNYINAILK